MISVVLISDFSAGDIYLFKLNKRNTSTMCEICTKLSVKMVKWCHLHRSVAFIVNFEQISHFVLVFPKVDFWNCFYTFMDMETLQFVIKNQELSNCFKNVFNVFLRCCCLSRSWITLDLIYDIWLVRLISLHWQYKIGRLWFFLFQVKCL